MDGVRPSKLYLGSGMEKELHVGDGESRELL
jgi:hypothetical protein